MMEFTKVLETKGRDVGVYLADAHEHKVVIRTREYDSKEPILDIEIRARRLGNLGSKDTMLYIGRFMIEFIDNNLKRLHAEIPKSEKQQLAKWVESHPWNGKIKAEFDIQEIY